MINNQLIIVFILYKFWNVGIYKYYNFKTYKLKYYFNSTYTKLVRNPKYRKIEIVILFLFKEFYFIFVRYIIY